METLSQDLLHELFEYKDGNLYWKSKADKDGGLKKATGWIRRNYRNISVKNKSYAVHRLIYLYFYGYLPQEIDHIDGNPLNNLIENLRKATHQENMLNKKIYKNNKSGYKGVCWHKASKKWRSQIYLAGKQKVIGYFDCPKKAHSAYCENAKTLHKDYANFG